MQLGTSFIAVALLQFLLSNTCHALSNAEVESAVEEIFDTRTSPKLLLGWERLTLDASDSGLCKGIFDVVVEDIEGRSLTAPCHNGKWKLHDTRERIISKISQITNTASISVKDLSNSESASTNHMISVTPKDLVRIIPTLKPGDHVVLSSGTLSDTDVLFPANIGTAEGPPIVIDAGIRVVISGNTRFKVSGENISFTNFNFADVGDQAITVTGRGFSLTHSQFDKCGDPLKPESQCIMLTGDASNADISFNEFVGSQSMTIKVRENTGGSRQPLNARIRYNVFRDIEKLSKNGQEPIQIAGQNGGQSGVDFATHIEHNIFYKTNGDRETISLKGVGIFTRWNVFYDMDAAPNFRGTGNNEFSGNVMIQTRPLRVAGNGNRVERNFIACPLQSFAILVSHGSKGYPAATNSTISNNILIARSAMRFAGQEQPVTQLATGNLIENNSFFTELNNPAILDSPQGQLANSGNTDNILKSALCKRKFKNTD